MLYGYIIQRCNLFKRRALLIFKRKLLTQNFMYLNKTSKEVQPQYLTEKKVCKKIK